MSYNTRNRQSVGRGAQVLYHQQQSRQTQQPLAPTGLQNQRPDPGYSTPTQPKPVFQDQNREVADNPRFGQQFESDMSPTPAKSILKQSPSTPLPQTPAASAQESSQEDLEMGEQNGSTTEKVERPDWLRRLKKVPGFKVDKKVRKRRQNARLRKILQPKNATVILNELKANELKVVCPPYSNPNTIPPYFTAQVQFDGRIFSGRGSNAFTAKQNAAENALRCYLMKLMTESVKKEKIGMEVEAEAEIKTEEIDKTDGESSKKKKLSPQEDDLPWGSLASFALYKLFEEWHSAHSTDVNARFELTLGEPGVQNIQKTGEVLQQQELKAMPPSMQNPISLLNQKKPGLSYSEVSREPGPGNTLIFTMRVNIEGQVFTGVAKNKKEAKRRTAIAALKGVYGINME